MIHFGILGAGNIAHRFAASLAKVEGAELVAASRRTAEKAAAFLAEVPCASGARAYGDHEALLADPEVDAIYLALPHDLHHAWALRALDAGKVVLCEKPAMLSEAEAAEVTAAARERGLLFMEAMKTRFVPLHPHVMDAVGALGPVARVHASLCNDALASYRTRDTYILGGGPGRACCSIVASIARAGSTSCFPARSPLSAWTRRSMRGPTSTLMPTWQSAG